MAETYAAEVAGLGTIPTTAANGGVQGGRVRRFRSTITLASQADGDTVVLATVPAGYTFSYGILNSSVTLGASTIAIGVSGTAGKYRASAVHTVTVPTLFGLYTAADDDPLTAAETVILTNATAALPAAGTLVVELFFSAP